MFARSLQNLVSQAATSTKPVLVGHVAHPLRQELLRSLADWVLLRTAFFCHGKELGSYLLAGTVQDKDRVSNVWPSAHPLHASNNSGIKLALTSFGEDVSQNLDPMLGGLEASFFGNPMGPLQPTIST